MSSVELEERQGEVEVETVPSRGRAGEDDDLEQGEEDDLEQGEEDDPEQEEEDDFQEEERRGPARFKDSHVVTGRGSMHCKSGSFEKYLNQLYSTDQIAMVWCIQHQVIKPFCSLENVSSCKKKKQRRRMLKTMEKNPIFVFTGRILLLFCSGSSVCKIDITLYGSRTHTGKVRKTGKK
jgi:hypothetical protein